MFTSEHNETINVHVLTLLSYKKIEFHYKSKEEKLTEASGGQKQIFVDTKQAIWFLLHLRTFCFTLKSLETAEFGKRRLIGFSKYIKYMNFILTIYLYPSQFRETKL